MLLLFRRITCCCFHPAETLERDRNTAAMHSGTCSWSPVVALDTVCNVCFSSLRQKFFSVCLAVLMIHLLFFCFFYIFPEFLLTSCDLWPLSWHPRPSPRSVEWWSSLRSFLRMKTPSRSRLLPPPHRPRPKPHRPHPLPPPRWMSWRPPSCGGSHRASGWDTETDTSVFTCLHRSSERRRFLSEKLQKSA